MYLHSAELACQKVPRGSLTAGREKNYPRSPPPPLQERSRELDRRLGGAKLNGSDRECKYFTLGMNERALNLLCLKNAGLLPFRNLFSLEPLESGTCLLLDLT